MLFTRTFLISASESVVTTVLLGIHVYLHKQSNDEDSILLPQRVLQRVEEGAVPVNEMELGRHRAQHNLRLRGHCCEQVCGAAAA